MEGVPLDDRRFDPFFAAAAELGVPVMLHPYSVGPRPRLADFSMSNLTGSPMETCVAATRLILSGFLDRHPAVKLVLVHAGGFLPYQIGRLDHGFRVRDEARAAIASPPSAYLRRFWYDTITHAGKPFEFLIELVGPDRMMVGTDLPFDMADTRFRTYLSTGAYALAPATRTAIMAGNALALFGLPGASAPTG
jgi:aminocarboxymuconate-semialdehyde decarboxylase